MQKKNNMYKNNMTKNKTLKTESEKKIMKFPRYKTTQDLVLTELKKSKLPSELKVTLLAFLLQKGSSFDKPQDLIHIAEYLLSCIAQRREGKSPDRKEFEKYGFDADSFYDITDGFDMMIQYHGFGIMEEFANTLRTIGIGKLLMEYRQKKWKKPQAKKDADADAPYLEAYSRLVSDVVDNSSLLGDVQSVIKNAFLEECMAFSPAHRFIHGGEYIMSYVAQKREGKIPDMNEFHEKGYDDHLIAMQNHFLDYAIRDFGYDMAEEVGRVKKEIGTRKFALDITTS